MKYIQTKFLTLDGEADQAASGGRSTGGTARKRREERSERPRLSTGAVG